MALYICPHCGATFDEPFREEYNDGALREAYNTCPDCGNPDFEEAAQCRGCRDDLPYNKLIAGEYCPKCIDKAIRYHPGIVEEFMMLDDVRENFAEFLAEYHWEPWREELGR